ncbi:hypothetical protein [Aporhodopirellula aestuarii]|uniref:Uncharacterized protein n=1 Tax=Aporhodopirellula aestuarii TaxID=2950107 RepID=A0ABT0U236_9BACT|nr:hypothetical protein [Aporhodopirellula aestuarii]MCM2370954.1 hypothetical protein [Aporhodopirellula aestuarii]
MPLPVTQGASSVILPVRVLNDANAPVLGLTDESAGLVVEYKMVGEDSWTLIELEAGTIGEHTEGGWVEDTGGDGFYELGFPDAGINHGSVTRIRIKAPSQTKYRYDWLTAMQVSRDEVPSGETIATRVAELLSSLRIDVQQSVQITGDDLEFVRGDDYIAHPVRVNLDTSGLEDPNEDLSAFRLVLSVYSSETEALFAIAADIVGDPGSQYAMFAPPASLTETWAAGTFNLLYRIEYAANKYWTIKRDATFRVVASDTDPDDITDVTAE